MGSRDDIMIKVISTYVAVNIVVVGLIIIFNGIWPRSITGWALLFTLGFPICIFLEYIGTKLFGERINQVIDNSTKTVSISRILYVLLIGLTYLVVLGIIYFTFKGFWQKHFIFH